MNTTRRLSLSYTLEKPNAVCCFTSVLLSVSLMALFKIINLCLFQQNFPTDISLFVKELHKKV